VEQQLAGLERLAALLFLEGDAFLGDVAVGVSLGQVLQAGLGLGGVQARLAVLHPTDPPAELIASEALTVRPSYLLNWPA
jgi:hypothetical protein